MAAAARASRLELDMRREWHGSRFSTIAPMPEPPGPRARVAVVHHGFVPTYRVPFFERLAATGEVEYVIFHGQAPARTGHEAAPGPFAFPDVRVRNRELRLHGRTVIVQPIVRHIPRGGFDGVVVGAEFKFPASWAAAAVTKARGGALVLWGHGYDKLEDEGAARLQRAQR